MPANFQCPTCQSIVKPQSDFQERCPRCGTFLEAGSPTEQFEDEQVSSGMDAGNPIPKPDTQSILDNANRKTAFAHGETISHRHVHSVSKYSATKLPIRHVKQANQESGFQLEYRLTGIIGEGNMGRVWLAEQTSLGREIAIKYPKRDASLDTSPIDEMFVSEVRVTGKLDHPNIISIYELGRDELGSPFYTMKHVRGKSWLQLLKDQTLEHKLDILLKVSDAIAFAHAKGYLHRDIKPENVMVGEFGEVVVMDWGIAIKDPLQNDDHSECHDRALEGTPAYMAPEMASGFYTDLGVHSDIYLLGAVLYQMIEGIPPHPKTSDLFDALEKVRMNQIVKPIQTGELISIANKALATDPKDRFATVKEFQEAIKAYQSHVESIRLTDQGTRYLAQAIEESSPDLYSQSRFAFLEALRIWTGNQSATDALRKAKIAHAQYCLSQGDYTNGLSLLDGNDDEQIALIRNIRRKIKEREKREGRSRIWRLLALSMSSLVFFLAIGFLVAMVHSIIADDESKKNIAQERNNAVGQQKSAQDNEIKALENGYIALQQTQRAEKSSYRANIRLANEQIRRNEFGDAKQTLGLTTNNVSVQRPDQFFRHIEYWMLSDLTEKSQQNTLKLESVNQPSGESVSLISPGAIGFLRIQGNAIYETEAVDSLVSKEKTDQQFEVYKQTDPSQFIIAAAMSSSGDYLAVVLRKSDTSSSKNLQLNVHRRVRSDDKQHKHFQPFGNKPIESNELKTESCKNIVFSRDGNWIAISGSDSKAQVIACTWQLGYEVPEKCTELPCLKNDFVYQAVFSPDSKYIATGCEDGIVRVWRLNNNGWEYFGRFDDHEGPVYSVAFSPDGDKVISGGLDRKLLIRRLGDAPLSKNKVEEVVNREPLDRKNAIFFIGNDDQDSHDGSIRSIAVGSFSHRHEDSPDAISGLFIATGSNDQTIRVWKVSDDALELFKVLRGHTHPVDDCQFRANNFELLSVASGEYRFWDILKYNFPTQLQGLREDRFSNSFLLKNPGAVRSVATSSDGRWVGAGFSDASLIAWDFSTPNALSNVLRPEGHAFGSKSAVWLGGGKQLITSGGDDTACIWDHERMVQSEVLRGTGSRGVVAASLWTKGEPQVLLTGSSQAGSLGSIWVESQSGFVRVPVPRANQLRCDATCLAISQDATQIAIGDDQGDLHLYRFDRTRLECEYKSTWSLSNSGLVDLYFVDGDKSVLVATEDGIIQKRNFSSGEVEFDIHVPPNVTSMVVSHESSKFFLGFGEVRNDNDLLIACYDYNDTTFVVQTIRGSLRPAAQSNEILKIIDLQTNHLDGSIVGILESTDANKGLLDIAQKLIRLTKNQTKFDHELIALKLPYAANGLLSNSYETSDSILVVGGSGGRFVNINAKKPETDSVFSKGIFETSMDLASLSISEFQGDSDPSIKVRHMAAGLDNGKILIWELKGNRWNPFQSLTLDPKESVHLCFNPAVPNELIVFGQKTGMQIYQKIGGRYRLIKSVIDPQDPKKTNGSGEINKVTLSKDGLAFAVASTEGMLLYVRDTIEEKSPWKCRAFEKGPCFDICFSSDSKMLYCTRADDVGECLMSNITDQNYRPQIRKVPAERFVISPDGKRLVHFDREVVKISDISDRYDSVPEPIELLQFEDHKDRVTDIKFLYNENPSKPEDSQCALITADSTGKIFLKWFTPEISQDPQGIPTVPLAYQVESTSKESSRKSLKPFEDFFLVDPMQQLKWESYCISIGVSQEEKSDSRSYAHRSREIEDRIRLYEYSHTCSSKEPNGPQEGSKDKEELNFQKRVTDYMTSFVKKLILGSNTNESTKPKALTSLEVKVTLKLTPSRTGQPQSGKEESAKPVTIKVLCPENDNDSREN